ncbi:MAG: PIG-L family deacetylase [Acidobacteriota bacterium]|jgi:LmbE family N-acetylglucosaminyl deacetylase|nr:PIG-L family deacetylase [Acidobacteriota bacterium]
MADLGAGIVGYWHLIRNNVARYPADMMRLLGITAHPDDEVGAFGGSLLLYRSRGVETGVICLTAGEAATNKGAAESRQQLAAIRRGEFAASCKILQVAEAEILDYPDGGLTRTDLHGVVGDLVRRIRRFKPHLILTMGPEGAITGHLDHAMASLFATMAFHWAARTDRYPEHFSEGLEPHRAQKLYYCTAPIVLPDRQPVSPPPCTATIDVAPFLDAKIKASQAHLTQKPLMDLFAKTLRKFGGREFFHLAAANRMLPVEHETDLLAGLSE